MEMLGKLIRLNRSDLWLGLGVVGGLFLLIHLGTALILKIFFASEGSSLLLSGVVLPIAAAFVSLFVVLGNVMTTYTLTVKFSQTRRRAAGLTVAMVSFFTACSMVLAALLTLLERVAAPRFWLWLTGAQWAVIGSDVTVSPEPATGAPVDPAREVTLFIEDFTLDWWWFPLLALAAIALGLVIGAILLRFGARGGWMLWCIWMAACFLPQLGVPALLENFLTYLYILSGVTFVVLLIWSVWYLLHAPMKN